MEVMQLFQKRSAVDSLNGILQILSHLFYRASSPFDGEFLVARVGRIFVEETGLPVDKGNN